MKTTCPRWTQTEAQYVAETGQPVQRKPRAKKPDNWLIFDHICVIMDC